MLERGSFLHYYKSLIYKFLAENSDNSDIENLNKFTYDI